MLTRHVMATHHDHDDELTTIATVNLDKVSGGAAAGMDMSSMLPMMMMMNKKKQAAAGPPPGPPPPAAPAAPLMPKIFVNGVEQSASSGGDGSFNVG
jgi:hypothetical protein